MRALDWLARTIFLILAGSATLALIGSLASVSDSALSDAFPGRVAQAPEASPEGAAPSLPERNASGRTDDPAQVVRETGTTTAAVRAPVSSDAREIARWLKALTYAVLALAGFAAAGLVALIRVATQLGRIADR